jgi:hypothetical protein
LHNGVRPVASDEATQRELDVFSEPKRSISTAFIPLTSSEHLTKFHTSADMMKVIC